jgi:hypothetical protein
MSLISALVITFVILIITVFIAFKYGKDLAGKIRILGVGVILANIVLLLPLPILDREQTNFTLSVLGALQAAFLNSPYDAYISAAEEQIYRIVLSVILILSPLLVGSIILTFFEGVTRAIKLWIFSGYKNVYYFSELNDKSFMLANDIKANTNPLIIFYNILPENPLSDKAKNNGYLLFEESSDDMKFYGKRLRYFFEIKENMSENLSGASQLISRFSDYARKERINIYLLDINPETEIIMDATDKKGISVTIINEPVTLVNNLFFDMPLYEALEKTQDKKISVLVVGAGVVGIEAVKNAAWCGQMGNGSERDDIPLEINVIDIEAEFIERKFRMTCPELMNGGYNIHFFQVDVQTCQFEEVLNKSCRDTNYIVVSLSSDELNIKTALFLRGYYLRTSGDFTREPLISVQISNKEKFELLPELTAVNRNKIKAKNWGITSDQAQNYNLYPFGSCDSVFTYKVIVDSPLERMAKNVHATYDRIFDPKIEKTNILYNYNTNETGKRSSRANALHIKYKLYLLGYELVQPKKEDTYNYDNDLEKFKQLLNDEKTLTRLAEIEHYSWNAYQSSEGYRRSTVAQTEIYKVHTNGSHKHLRAKLHTCICPWEDLPELVEKYDKHMIDYDVDLIRSIPVITGAENNPDLNLGGVNFKIKKRD